MKKQKYLQFLNSIKNEIIINNLLVSTDLILLAISGGQDSIVILFIFFILKNQFSLNFKILYCNHIWDQHSVHSYYHLLKISFCLNINLFYSISLKELKSEEKSRYWRVKNYNRLKTFIKCSTLITGHTLTDQIETFFFNTIRGSGFTGSLALKQKKNFIDFNKNDFLIEEADLLKFKRTKKKIIIKKKVLNFHKKKVGFLVKKNFLIHKKKSLSVKIIRPLLKKNRFDVKNICKNYKLPIFPDQSNEKRTYTRNRLRKQVLPTFRFYFNPRVDLSLSRYINIVMEEENNKEKLIRSFLKKVIQEDKNGYFFNIALFSSLPVALQKRICYFFFKEKLKLNYNFFILESFTSFCNDFYTLNKKKEKIMVIKKPIINVFFPEIGTIYFSKTLFIFFR
jgi:tRNA(Ile)-lysidine synthase TilS/MesJ